MDIELLKERKQSLGLTLTEVAEKAGISRSTAARIFGPSVDPHNVTVSTYNAIARALGIDPDGLSDTARETVTPREYRLLSAYRDLDETTQTLCVVLVEKLAEKTPRK